MTLVRSALAATLLAFSLNALADLSDVPSGEYTLDPMHGYITFSYSHLGFSRPQIQFRKFDVDLNLDSANPENSQVNVVIDAKSVDSHVDVFNGHLNGTNFFDTEKFPDITFKSTKIVKKSADTFDVTGDLTIKGITKPVTLATTINKAGIHPMRKAPAIGVSATGTVSRAAFGMDRAAPAVGDEVTITINAELPQKKAD